MKIVIKDQNGVILHESIHEFDKKPLKIGRAESNDIILKNLSISREHLILQKDSQGQVCLQDLQSTFGTYVNGKKVQGGFVVQVGPNDKIQLSEEVFLSLIPDEKENQQKTSISSETTIFPFFLEANNRFVNEVFTNLRAQIPPEYNEKIDLTEKSITEKIKELSAILEVTYAMSSTLSFQRLLEYTIDMALKVTGAERGFIMLYNEESDKLETSIIRRMGATEVERDMKASTSLVLKCFKTGETLIIADTSLDPNLVGNKSIIANKIHSVALTPLKIKNVSTGVLYLDSRVSKNTFSPRVQELLKVFAAQASVAIYNAKLFFMATTDGLTGLTNHKHFQQRLLEEFCRSNRHGKPLSLLMMDIDHFKSINDTYGHQVGDQVLRQLSRILKSNMRIHDIPARYGGEEFAVLLPETNLEGAKALAEKLRSIVEQCQFKIGHKNLKFTISIGIATSDKRTTKPFELVRIADQALYRAKAEGRNRVHAAEAAPAAAEDGKQELKKSS